MVEKSDGEGYEETVENDGETFNNKPTEVEIEEVNLYSVFRRLISAIVSSDGGDSAPLLQRIRASVSDNAPLLPEASRNTSRNVLLWTRRGSPLRALLVLSVGGIVFLSLTGLLVFMLFFLVATFNVMVVSLIVSLAAAGGFLALFFVCVAAIYVCALSIAAFVISATVISATIAVIITTGWIGFFCTVWLATKTSIGLAKRSLSATSSALSAYSNARHGRGGSHEKVSD